ncbi:hypothetical protein BHE90_005976 [Fusarium euwallaceae]|uniref:Uncharacterized protein n=1 Tax=Fusarium euwallaceae TaxID=1147111 RepID=A0A430LV31_9HYPO|nr:hypothetical protein BHE90_005976 [Fusarium euwallaceae]
MTLVLDRAVPEWRILVDVLPLFALDAWQPRGGVEVSITNAQAEDIEFETNRNMFSNDMEAMLQMVPKHRLTVPALRSCTTALSKLLDFLEDKVVLGSVLTSDHIEPPFSNDGVSSWYYHIPRFFLEWRDAVQAQPTKTMNFAFASSQAREIIHEPMAEAARNSNGVSDPEGRYKKLITLGMFIKKRQKDQSEGRDIDLVKDCEEFIQWEHGSKEYEQGRRLTERISDSFAPAKTPTRQWIDETNWKYDLPRELSTQLFRVLNLKTCHEHQAKLQLNGFLLNRQELREHFKLEVFLSSCPPPVEHWQQGRYKVVCQKNDNAYPINDLCIHARRSSSAGQESNVPLSVLFSEDDMFHSIYDQPTPIDAVPTMSLSQLLNKGAFCKPREPPLGKFTEADKAVLALSLSRCLLHLFRGSWMREEWNADGIHFLRKTTDDGDHIFDIHHPYVTCALSDDVQGPGSYPGGEVHGHECQPFLWSFAKLLLEIQSGAHIPLELSDPAFQKGMWDEIEQLPNNQGGKDYIRAITGCLYFTKGLAREHRTTLRAAGTGFPPTNASYPLNVVRKTIYEDVVKPLEAVINGFPDFTKVLRQGSLLLPADQEQSIRPVTPPKDRRDPQIVAQKHPAQYLPIECLTPTNPVAGCNSSTVSVTKEALANAQTFTKQFQVFQRRFMTPKMENCRGGRVRVKIALLDTGIDLNHIILHGMVTETRTNRRNQGFKDKETNPVKKYWPGKRDADDTCGHGTHLAYLLLKFAPDADLYIAKIGSNTEDGSPFKIRNAIKWAVKQQVDIITMSFGCTYIDGDIGQGIDCAVKVDGPRPLLFAAASNHGAIRDRSYPASDRNVICVHTLGGIGGESDMNPPRRKEEHNFATFGCGVSLSWKGVQEVKSGTSYATPILAAIAANWIDWLGWCRDEGKLSPAEYDGLRTDQMIREIFASHMSTEVGDLKFVAPWHLFPAKEIFISPGASDDEKAKAERNQDAKTEVDALGKIRLRMPTYKPATVLQASEP